MAEAAIVPAGGTHSGKETVTEKTPATSLDTTPATVDTKEHTKETAAARIDEAKKTTQSVTTGTRSMKETKESIQGNFGAPETALATPEVPGENSSIRKGIEATKKEGAPTATISEKKESHKNPSVAKKENKQPSNNRAPKNCIVAAGIAVAGSTGQSAGAIAATSPIMAAAKKFESGMRKSLEELGTIIREVENEEHRQKLTTLVSKAKFLLDDSAELFNKLAAAASPSKKGLVGPANKQMGKLVSPAGTQNKPRAVIKATAVATGAQPAAATTTTTPNVQQRKIPVQQLQPSALGGPVNMSVQRRLFGNRNGPQPYPVYYAPPAVPNYVPDMFFRRTGFQPQPPSFVQKPNRMVGPAGQSVILSSMRGPMMNGGTTGPIYGGFSVPQQQRRLRRDVMAKEQDQANVRKSLREASTIEQLEKALERAQRMRMDYEVGNAKTRLNKMKAAQLSEAC